MRLLNLKNNKKECLAEIKHSKIKCLLSKEKYNKELQDFENYVKTINDEEKLMQMKNELLELKNNESRFACYLRKKYDDSMDYNLYSLYSDLNAICLYLLGASSGLVAALTADFMNKATVAGILAWSGLGVGLGACCGFMMYQRLKFYYNNEHSLIEKKIEEINNQNHSLMIEKISNPTRRKRLAEVTK